MADPLHRPLAVEVWHAADGGRFAGIAGGSRPPPLPAAGRWWVRPLPHLPLGPSGLAGLAAWMARHAADELRLDDALATLRDADLAVLAAVPGLRRLTLAGHAPHLTPRLVESLAGCAALEELSLFCCDLDDAACAALGRLPRLRALSVRVDQPGDGLRTWVQLERLTVLGGASPAALAAIARLPRLRALSWADADLDQGFWQQRRGAGLEELAVRSLGPAPVLPELRGLALPMRLDAAMLALLPRLQRLEAMDFAKDAVAALPTACPELASVALSHRIDGALLAALAGRIGHLRLRNLPETGRAEGLRLGQQLAAFARLELWYITPHILRGLAAAGAATASLSIRACDFLSAKDLTLLALPERIEQLLLEHATRLDDRALAAIAAPGRLRSLAIEGSVELGGAGLRALAACRQLAELHLASCEKVSRSALAVVAALPALRRLQVADGLVPPEAAGCPELDLHDQVLSVERLTAPTWAGLRAMRAPPALRLGAVDDGAVAAPGQLARLEAGGGGGLAALIAANPGLSVLAIDDPDPAALAALARLPHLASLRLRLPRRVAGLAAAIAQLTGLGRLHLAGPGCERGVLAAVAGLRHLSDCSFEDAMIDAAALARLAGRAPLQRLALLRCTGVDDAVLAACGRAPRLEDLRIEGTVADGAGLAGWPEGHALARLAIADAPRLAVRQLAGLARLGRLEALSFVQVPGLDDRLWPLLLSMPGLRTVALLEARGMSPEAVEAVERQLQEEARGLHIRHDLLAGGLRDVYPNQHVVPGSAPMIERAEDG